MAKISRGVEIAIAGGVEEMVHDISLKPEGLSCLGIFPPLTQVTHHLTLHNSYDS